MQTKPGMFQSWADLLKWPLTVSAICMICGIFTVIALCWITDTALSEMMYDAWMAIKR